MRILFVDDEKLILSAIRRVLRTEGYELFFTENPFDANKMIAEHNIDLIVSDHMMPEMTGVELLGICKRLHPGTTRIMMTGQADRDATIRAINEGSIHKFIEKPWNDDDLRRILREIARTREIEAKMRDQTPSRTILRDASGAIVINDSAEEPKNS